VAYFISDHWLARWEREHWDSWYEFWHHPAKTGARKLAASAGRGFFGAIGLLPSGSRLNLSNVQFASDYLRRDALSNGLEVATAKTIHWGIDSGFFDVDRTRQTGHAAPLRLLYAGQVRKHKGVHTAIEALARLPAPCDKVTLSIVGGSTEPKYEEELHALAAKLGVSDRVRFAGPRPRAELPGIYAEHDLLVFPSIWEEPFSITLVEAMAAGLAVVGTTRGGSAEILKDGVNALTFPANDPAACAAALVRAISEPGLLARLGASARDTVNRSFTREIMLDKIESALQAAVQTGRDRV